MRHGESTDNVAGVLSSRPPGAPLTDTGSAQAWHAVSRLRRERVTAVYSGSAHRAVETAGIAAAGLGVPGATLAGLGEYGLGDCEGTTDADSRARCGAVMRGWIVDRDLDSRLPGGESAREVADRFTDALRTVVGLHPGQTVAVVSHVGTLTIGLLALCRDLGPDDVWGRLLPHAVPFPVDFDGTDWHCPTWPGVPSPHPART